MRKWLAVVPLMLVLCGCTATNTLFGANRQASTAAPISVSTPEADDLSVYLNLMRSLVNGDALARSATFNDARDAAEYAPTRINRLNYALALSVPGHAGFDPAAAATRLRALLAAGPTLSAPERTLTEIQLHLVEQFQLVAENQRQLERQIAEAGTAKDAAVAAGIRPLQAENDRLREELEAAENMLEAITNIEESLSGSQNP